MSFSSLDRQLSLASAASEVPSLKADVWPKLATTIVAEIGTLGHARRSELRLVLPIEISRYREELESFQSWTEFAHRNSDNPVIVRAQVMTELYVSFVWLRDSVISPVASAFDAPSTYREVFDFLDSGTPRKLRNAVAHGRWSYRPDFDGLDCWDGPHGGQLKPFTVTETDLTAWQTLARGLGIATVLALT